MKVSLNWLRDFLDIYKSPSEIADILTSLGLEVEGFEAVKPSQVDLDKVVTGLVVECERIPETDHLSATKVDVGDGAIRSIVCGAPNVAVGQKVLVAVPGANVFSKDGDLFTIGERKVKGVPSQGMICAQDELGIGHDHSGIMVLPADTPLGVPASEYLNMPSDTVFEVGLTPNRADATNHRGIAQDLLAWVRQHENKAAQLKFQVADLKALTPEIAQSGIQVTIENTEACPRYTGVSILGVQVGESPDWLKNRLLSVGQRPINNVVDITNYVRIELGQPLHAFDQDAIQNGKVVVKTLPEGTIFKSLDEQDRTLFAEDLIICDGASNPMCIGGVFGGLTSGVKNSTVNVFLESAFFNPKFIRRSMLRHNLRTDAAWTFEKGVDPNGAMIALQRAAALIQELAGGKIAGPAVDIYPHPVQSARIPVQFARINTLIGENLSVAAIKQILTALEIHLDDETAEGGVAVIPTNKPDVLREADVVEEILRVYGLDTVAMPLSIRSSMEITPKPDPDAIRNQVADMLAAQGFNECMSLSLNNSAWYTGDTAMMPVEAGSLIMIHNTANQGLDCLRPSLIPGALEAIQRNQNRQSPDLRLFEFGKTYKRLAAPSALSGEKFEQYAQSVAAQAAEVLRLGIFMTGAHSSESWNKAAKKEVDFYTLKTYVTNLLARLGISGYQETALSREGAFQYALRLHRGPQELVTLGSVQPALAKRFDVKNAVFCADFHFENVIAALTNNKVQYTELSKFPTVRRDLALVVDKAVSFGDVRQLAGKTVKKVLKDVNLFDVFEDESKLGAGKKSYAISFVFEDAGKTMQDKEIDAMMNQLQQAFESKLGALIRK